MTKYRRFHTISGAELVVNMNYVVTMIEKRDDITGKLFTTLYLIDGSIPLVDKTIDEIAKLLED